MAAKSYTKVGYVVGFVVWYLIRVALYAGLVFLAHDAYVYFGFTIHRFFMWGLTVTGVFGIFSFFHLVCSLFRERYPTIKTLYSTLEYIIVSLLPLGFISHSPRRAWMFLVINLIVISLASLIPTSAFIRFFQNLLPKKSRKAKLT